MAWIQHQPGTEPIKPLGHYRVPLTVSCYDQQEILRAYSPSGAPTQTPTGWCDDISHTQPLCKMSGQGQPAAGSLTFHHSF